MTRSRSQRRAAAIPLALASLVALLPPAGPGEAAPRHNGPLRAPLPPAGGAPTAPSAAAPAAAPAPAAPVEGGQPLHLHATLSNADQQPLRAGLVWRLYEEGAQPDGSHKLVAQSAEAQPTLMAADGSYILHAAFGLAGVTKRVVVEGRPVSERVHLNAGGLKLINKLGESTIPAQRLSISIYVPEKGNSQAKLILANANADGLVGLPEGSYHVVSTLLDTAQAGQNANATNSVVNADLRVPAGKLIEATLRHHAATMTLKLVKQPGGEALANTNFSVLTPGGDVIRELIGAFPSLVLAEGEYVAIARYQGKTYQQTFRVQSARDSDVEILAREGNGESEPSPTQ